jgi:hypothetical protein
VGCDVAAVVEACWVPYPSDDGKGGQAVEGAFGLACDVASDAVVEQMVPLEVGVEGAHDFAHIPSLEEVGTLDAAYALDLGYFASDSDRCASWKRAKMDLVGGAVEEEHP